MAKAACPRASRHVLRLRRRLGSGIKACARAAGFTARRRGTLPTYMAFKSRLQGFAVKHVGEALIANKGTKRQIPSGRCTSPTSCPLNTTTLGSIRSSTVIWRSTFRTLRQHRLHLQCSLPACRWRGANPGGKERPCVYQWGLDNNYPAIGFYSAYPGFSVQDIRALLADYGKSPSATAG